MHGLARLLWPLLTSPLQVQVPTETSPGKNTFFQSIAATSTTLGLLPAGIDMLCCLARPKWPLMWFLFVGTNFCSPAYFRLRVAPDALAAC